ncbi:MAG: hypothetical protein C0445_04720 [Polaromonas sp.]|nr:hypothetical protein [Polaromonas sp.]
MLRRHLLLSTCALALPLRAQAMDLADAINQAGRQRMLSQRMAKAWLALAQGTEPVAAKAVLNKSMALFERQLADLQAQAPTTELRQTYQQLDAAWRDYQRVLLGHDAAGGPRKAQANAVLAADATVLALAHQGTVQYEAVLAKPVGKLVNLAGRQRMLSQRMAKLYLAASLAGQTPAAAADMAQSRTEFVTAMATLRQAPQTTARIQDALQLADGQWVFFDAALQRLHGQPRSAKAGSEVFVTSENLLSVMDMVTGLYSGISA